MFFVDLMTTGGGHPARAYTAEVDLRLPVRKACLSGKRERARRPLSEPEMNVNAMH